MLLILVPLAPNVSWAVTLLLLRFALSQMDVPKRRAYLLEVVQPDKRSAASGITGIARTIGSALAPLFIARIFKNPVFFNFPFYLAGGLKIVYDFVLYRSFKSKDHAAGERD